MKKLKTGLLAVALVAGVAGAFIPKISTAAKLVDPTYDWDKGGDNPLPNASISTAQDFYDCHGTVTPCQTGTLDPSSPVSGPSPETIFQN